MKKILTITIITLMFALSATTSYAYWNGGKLSLPPLLSVQHTIKIGQWKKPVSNEHPIGTADPFDIGKLGGIDVVFKDGVYYLVYDHDMGGASMNSPWVNPLKPYGLDYLRNTYYHYENKPSMVRYQNKIYIARHGGAPNDIPNDKEYQAWGLIGSVSVLTWNSQGLTFKGEPYKVGTTVMYNDKLYIRNNFNTEKNPIPGTDMGWNLYNDLYFDQYTVYKSFDWKYVKNMKPVIAAPDKNGEMRLFKLMKETNYINGRLVKPTEDNSVWSPYPYE
ncbi:hypothetical protein ERUR111494_06310 [Erysipelothrix urinaevulpis]|uniref:hypothetical protein n=1 Tax=Erysipelothrix urinaevulpis TaxID=2683717 RepID=UPI00135ACD08|nr:hypothetical protein [Erysipelothrix urinaevulpis]